jgi:hypothetical protein
MLLLLLSRNSTPPFIKVLQLLRCTLLLLPLLLLLFLLPHLLLYYHLSAFVNATKQAEHELSI